jgi:hypothetical protein
MEWDRWQDDVFAREFDAEELDVAADAGPAKQPVVPTAELANPPAKDAQRDARSRREPPETRAAEKPAHKTTDKYQRRGSLTDDQIDRRLERYHAEIFECFFTLERLDPRRTETGLAILQLDAAQQAEYFERIVTHLANGLIGHPEHSFRVLLAFLQKRSLPFDQAALARMLWRLADFRGKYVWPLPTPNVLTVLERYLSSQPLSAELRRPLEEVDRLYRVRATSYDDRRLRQRIDRILRSDQDPAAEPYRFATREAWVEAFAAFLATCSSEQNAQWRKLLEHAEKAVQGKPSKRWLQTAGERMADVGNQEFQNTILPVLACVGRPGGDRPRRHDHGRHDDLTKVLDTHADLLRGIVWMLGLLDDTAVSDLLGQLIVVGAESQPMQTPRCLKLSFAAIIAMRYQATPYALRTLGQVVMQVKQKSVRRRVDDAMRQLSKLPSVRAVPMPLEPPDYQFGQFGCYRETIGLYTAACTIATPGTVTCTWSRKDEPPQPNVPKIVKQTHRAELERLKNRTERLRSDVCHWRLQLERLYFSSYAYTWDELRRNLLDHELLGPLARCLIWRSVNGTHAESVMLVDDAQVITARGELVASAPSDARFQLWHPLDASEAEVTAWRDTMEQRKILQPFPQAHRSVYRLAQQASEPIFQDDRFAQQFMSRLRIDQLVEIREWLTDAPPHLSESYSPLLELPEWDVRATWRLDISAPRDSPSKARSGPNTGPVEFTRLSNSEPLDARTLPPRVVSEILRDIEFFFLQYGNEAYFLGTDLNRGLILKDAAPRPIQAIAIGPATELARTRRDILARLVARSRIAAQCTFREDRVEVQGALGHYEVHLNSGFFRTLPDDLWYRGLLTIFSHRRHGILSEQVDFQLPFAGDLRFADIAELVYWLANDDQIVERRLAERVATSRSGA